MLDKRLVTKESGISFSFSQTCRNRFSINLCSTPGHPWVSSLHVSVVEIDQVDFVYFKTGSQTLIYSHYLTLGGQSTAQERNRIHANLFHVIK